MNKYFYALGGVILLIAAIVVMKPKAVNVETVVLQRGVFDETLISEGKIRSREKKTVYAFATGNIESIMARVGDVVKKGQVLTRLEWDKTVSVTSPIDGVITRIYRDSAGPILRGEPIFEVSTLSDLEVVADVLTPEAIRLSVKGEAKILNWGGEEELEARVTHISRAGVVKISALGVEEERTEVKLAFEKVPEELKTKFGTNYHVDIVFLISREENALVVPLGALFKIGEKWAVYVVQDGRARSREIEITKRNERQAVVAAGLQEGDRVILFPGDKIREGVRIKYTN